MTAAEYGAEELARLGDAVERYITDQGMQFTEVAERAGFSIETLSKIRKGVRVSATTYRKLERALGWAASSMDAVSAGGTPTLEPQGPTAVEVDEPVDPQAAAILTILDGLPVRVQAEVLRRLGDRLPPELRRTA
ncbi:MULTISPECIES: helix-turn-helix domain-containing protein [unclassified Streptomyces]|uniref:helix-turn-helix domain-containing protein n=1 Tax=unclassified Streptomyces TaxID=2593676 RepID=UPI0035E089BD